MKLLALALVAGLAGSAAATPPKLGGCPIFPASNPWNATVDKLPVAANSAAMIASIGPAAPVHADFGSGLYDGQPIGIPYNVVSGVAGEVARRVRVRRRERQGPVSDSGAAEDRGRIGPSHPDRRRRDACRLYELVRRAEGRSAAGTRGPARSGTCARTHCGRPAGRRPTRRGCRSSPASRATASPHRPRAAVHGRSARAARSSIRRVTTRASRPTRRCRRWAYACV